ncbi:MAG: hypothetical protein H7067_08680 [Burkholderiales bacterium]|nr:hypothetical protein [Opitutaceae bacterium]
MTHLADDTPAASPIRRRADLYAFRPVSGEEYAAEERTAARQGYVLAEAREDKAINFRWLLWAKEPLSTLDVVLAFHTWKKSWHDAGPPHGRVVSIHGPWAKRRVGRIPLEAREV